MISDISQPSISSFFSNPFGSLRHAILFDFACKIAIHFKDEARVAQELRSCRWLRSQDARQGATGAQLAKETRATYSQALAILPSYNYRFPRAPSRIFIPRSIITRRVILIPADMTASDVLIHHPLSSRGSSVKHPPPSATATIAHERSAGASAETPVAPPMSTWR